MTDHLLHARLFNSGGELIAEGPCWLDEAAGRATLEPEREPGVIQKERGELSLELDSGRTVAVSDSPMVFRLGAGAGGVGPGGRRSLYRLSLIDTSPSTSGLEKADSHAHDANAAGAAGEGAPAVPITSGRLRGNGETPAAS
ncbi:MAG: hypothetical protein IH866_04300 [Chloroflexi bacterium]|nr:hypothetical protein [Chloroflexota bacterium]